MRVSIPVLTADLATVYRLQVRSNTRRTPIHNGSRRRPGNPKTADVFMRNKFPYAPFIDARQSGSASTFWWRAVAPASIRLETTRRDSRRARVLAVDLSLASLCYAGRQTRALGRNAIQYAQADIMKLPSIGATFDIIEASGVLHHLADPFAGWRVLLSMLRPGGIMLLGLYSETARRDIVAARDFIAERGYQPTAR